MFFTQFLYTRIVMYYDAHTHLNEERLFKDRTDHLQTFSDVGGKGLINVGVDAEWNMRAIQIAEQASKKRGDDLLVKATIGIHPSEVSFGKISSSQEIASQIVQLKKLYDDHHDQIVAIGECGIDAHYPDYEHHRGLQQELFNAQCELARELGLPVVIHSRDQFTDTYEIIQDYADLKVYYHCRGYGVDELRILHDLLPRLRFGCCGNITYPSADLLRASVYTGMELALQTHPMHHQLHLLLETDAPYLTPQKNRGQLNTPAQVVQVYEYVSDMLGISLQELQVHMRDNFETLWGK